jgi:hypothetical protein
MAKKKPVKRYKGPHARPTGNPLGSPAVGRVRMAPRDGSQPPVEAWVHGQVLPTDSGYAGWVVVPREGQEGTVEYQGVEPKRWVLPLLADGWAEGVNVQADWDAILALAEKRGSKPPPQVWFAGTVPPGLSRRAWLIEKTSIEDEQLVDGSNRLLRGKLTLNLLAPTSTIDVASPIRQALAKGTGHGVRTIRARAGDTLVSIAARELGDPERWRDISAVNHGLQPDNVKAGQKIRLPAR